MKDYSLLTSSAGAESICSKRVGGKIPLLLSIRGPHEPSPRRIPSSIATISQPWSKLFGALRLSLFPGSVRMKASTREGTQSFQDTFGGNGYPSCSGLNGPRACIEGLEHSPSSGEKKRIHSRERADPLHRQHCQLTSTLPSRRMPLSRLLSRPPCDL